MKKDSEGEASIEAQKKAAQTQKFIVIIMVIFVLTPLLIVWISGELRF